MNHPQAWAVILAGGDGTRLRSFTRSITGEDRPKQFCQLFGDGTLLAQTRSRLAAAIAPEQTLFSVVKAHERFYMEELAGVPPARIVAQPSNKGTTAAIVSSLSRIAGMAHDPIVGFFPTDHHYSNETRFIASLRLALKVVSESPDTVILLGASAEYPEVEYGWIEPGLALECSHTRFLLRVNRFWEKPSAHFAEALRTRGCLWNTFVMIGRASAFLNLIAAAVPKLLPSFGIESLPSIAPERLMLGERAYAELTPGDFSRQVLAVSTGRLAVLPMGDVGWSDLGAPERVRFAMTRSRLNTQRQRSARNENLEDLAKTSIP